MCKFGYDKCKHQDILDSKDSFSRKFSIDSMKSYRGMPMGFFKWDDKSKAEHIKILNQGDICCDCLLKKLNIK